VTVAALHRAVYDQYGLKGLKEGVADGRGGIVKGTGKYTFGANGDSNEIFVRVFGTDNPFSELFQVSLDPATHPVSATCLHHPYTPIWGVPPKSDG
jgi:DnaJ-class molecular chaperone